MKIETLFWMTGIFFGILVILGWILYIDEKSKTRKKIGKAVFDFSWRIILFLYLMAFLGSSNKHFVLYSSQDFWEKYKLPQIDNMMPLLVSNRDQVNFTTISKDSIRHVEKSIEYDIFDIYSITDRFVNNKENKSLEITFIKPNIIRDSSRIIILEDFHNCAQIHLDTLSFNHGDSVLSSWGLKNIVYKKLLLFD